MSAGDAAAVRALADAYALAADSGDGAGLAALFLPDGQLDTFPADGTAGSHYTGRDDLATIPSRLARYERTLHMIGTHRSELAGPEGTAVTYCEAHHLLAGVDRVLYIRYDDDIAVGSDGRWRIRHRRVRVQWVDERRVGDG